MDGFTFNKIAGAVLGTLLFGFVVIEVSHLLYPNPRKAGHVEEMGYPVAAADHGETHGGNGETNGAAERPDFATLLASADPAAGEAQFRACGSCHAVAPGAAARIGPNLWGIVGSAIGAVDGFNYSNVMGGHGGTWTFENLSAFLQSPRDFMPGTAMSYAGMRRDTNRANLIAYLNSQSDAPLPLPTPPAAAEDVLDDAMDHTGEGDDGGAH